MQRINLEISQLPPENHPIIIEKEKYKIKYINFLEYFVKKYSSEDLWAKSVLKLYKDKLIGESGTYSYCEDTLKKMSHGLFSYKIRKWKLISYKYCFIVDCLFLNAFFDSDKGRAILGELNAVLGKKDAEKLVSFANELYGSMNITGKEPEKRLLWLWKTNKAFIAGNKNNIIFTANMSAGKSTLLNALVGKKVNKTQNESCTAKLHYIMNKPFEDNLTYEWDHDLELDASYEILMDDNVNNEDNEISVGTHFRSVFDVNKRICFIDTPGVNSYNNTEHKSITEHAIENTEYSQMVYLLNGTNIGTYDDLCYLQYIREHFNGKIIFAVNKLDVFRRKEDSVSETLSTAEKELRKIGFENPEIYPVSAYAGYMAKKRIYGEEFDDDEEYEFKRLLIKFRNNEFRFDGYYPESIRKKTAEIFSGMQEDEGCQLFLHSGILSLECMLYNI